MNENEIHNIFTKLIDREDTLANSRLTWFLTFEGFLFASFGICLTDTVTKFSSLLLLIMKAIPIAGAVISFSALFSVIRAHSSKRNLYKQYIENWESTLKASKIPSPFGNSSIPGSERSLPISFLNPGIVSPLVLLIVWVIIFIRVPY